MTGKDPTPLPRKAYTVAEVAAMTGLSVDAVYDLCASGELPSRKVGRRVIIPAKAVDEFTTVTS
jgi:excisionase family DNA binding protein